MKNSATNQTSFTDRLLSAILWELSLLGHKTLDLVKVLVRPGGWFRSLPHVRILMVLSMLVLIFHDDVSFSVGFGDGTRTESGSAIDPSAANAGFFSTPQALLTSVFATSNNSSSHTSAFAKTDLTVMDSQTGTALIERFDATARAEQAKLGVDAGVLLATAIAAGVVQSPEQVADLEFTTNYFGEALKGSYPTAWSSWRAMSLAIVATTESSDPTRDDQVHAAAAQFSDLATAKARIYEALRYYEL